MSNVVSGIVQRHKVGSPTRKAVLMFMAGCASDDGSGVWTSKANMAADLEMGKRTVQVCVDDLVRDGLISETGKRTCRNGYTVEYKLNLPAIQALESTRSDDIREAELTRAGRAPVQDVHPTRAGRAPQDVQDVHPNRTGTVQEPSEEPPLVPPQPKPAAKARLPDDWVLSDDGWAYARSQQIPDEAIRDEARGFHAYWTDRTDRDAKKSERGWEQCWAGWCRRIAPRYRGRVAYSPQPGRSGQGRSIASIAAQRAIERGH